MRNKNSIKMLSKKIISVTKGFQEFVHGTYEGDLRNGKKHGEGRFVWSQGELGTYEGEFSNGRMHGMGKRVWTSGDWEGYFYMGGWENDQRNGKGTLQQANGDVRYGGEWRNDKLCGQVTIVTCNGVYEGGFKDWKRCGKGKFVFTKDESAGNVLDGNWRNDKLQGKGMYTESSGSVYVGEFKNSKFNGAGKMTMPNNYYEGMWKDGHMHGQGKLVWTSGPRKGSSYEGEWRSGDMHGEGTLVGSDGSVYTGGWKKGVREGNGMVKERNFTYEGGFKGDSKNGFGKIVLDSGVSYEGEWKMGEMHGNGKFLKGDGYYYEGQWDTGRIHGNGKMLFDDGFYEGEWINGKIHGYGKRSFASGETLEGHWEKNVMNGRGEITCKNGDVVDGNWEDNKLVGLVTILHTNGDVHEGIWEDQKLVGKGKLTEKNGETFEGEWEYEEDEDGGTLVHFIYTSGEKEGQKYRMGLDEHTINISSDKDVPNEVMIHGVKMNLTDLAKNVSDEHPNRLVKLAKIMDVNSITAELNQRDELIKQLKEAENEKKASDSRLKAKLKEMLAAEVEKIKLMVILKTKIIENVKKFSLATGDEQTGELDDTGIEVDLTDKKKDEITAMSREERETNLEQMEITYTCEIMREIIKRRKEIGKHRRDLIEDELLSSYMEKYLKRNEKEMLSVQKKLVKYLKLNISVEHFQKFLDDHNLKEKHMDGVTLEEDIISLCYKVECKEREKHRCRRCKAVSYCAQTCADTNWDIHRDECVKISDVMDISEKGRKKRNVKKAFNSKITGLEDLDETFSTEVTNSLDQVD